MRAETEGIAALMAGFRERKAELLPSVYIVRQQEVIPAREEVLAQRVAAVRQEKSPTLMCNLRKGTLCLLPLARVARLQQADIPQMIQARMAQAARLAALSLRAAKVRLLFGVADGQEVPLGLPCLVNMVHFILALAAVLMVRTTAAAVREVHQTSLPILALARWAAILKSANQTASAAQL